MAKGDVVGVAFHPDEGVVRLQHDDGRGGEVPGDVIVWRPKDDDPRNVEGGWCEPKPDDEITPEDRLIYRGRPVPGKELSKQPPQETVELPQDVVDEGVALKAARYVTVHGSKKTAIRYLEDRVEHGFVTAETAQAIAGELGLKIDTRAGAQEG